MMHTFQHALAVACVLCAASGCSTHATGQTSASSTAAGKAGAAFANSGGDACDRFLTPDVAGQILAGQLGKPKKLSSQACSVTTTDNAGSITITLNVSGQKNFDAFLKYLVNPQPLAGVGDRAVQSMIGITAFKAPNMGCAIDAGGAPGSLKLHGQALGRKLGSICNVLFGAVR